MFGVLDSVFRLSVGFIGDHRVEIYRNLYEIKYNTIMLLLHSFRMEGVCIRR